MKLPNKVALITGSGSGIGRATALLFATEGAKVVVADLNAERGRATSKEIIQDNGTSIFIEADVSRSSDVRSMIDETIRQFGRLDILHNNAGIAPPGTVLETTEEEWDRVINTNLKSVFLGCKYALPHMIKQGGGIIINTASVNGLCAFTNEAA